jgi:hypothetical protein
MKRFWGTFLILSFACSGCATTIRHAPSDDVSEQASVSGMQNIRAFAGKSNDAIVNDIVGLLLNQQKTGAFLDKTPTWYNFLALSGGASYGAYGAGLLNGWSKSRTRPVFYFVTGISAGGIIAPFAFVGSKYDVKLKKFFTDYSTKDILHKKGTLPTLLGNSLASTAPLKHLIDKNVDEELLNDVAQCYKEGRRLYIGTTDLDSRRLVIWDMGKIASSGNPNALKLFRQIILASASIPVVFPPVFIQVESGGTVYDEMHVDGGISKNIFFIYDVDADLYKKALEKGIDLSKVRRRLYLILNGYTKKFSKEVPNTLAGIAQESFDLLATNKSVGEIYELYNLSSAHGTDFNLAYIPSDKPPKEKEFFDPIEMRRLFNLGFNAAENGYDWKKYPPGMDK